MKKILFALAAAAVVGTAPSDAANTSGTFNVNVTLSSTCSLSSIAALDFTYSSFQNTGSTATGGSYTVTCTNNLPYSFGLQAGTGTPVPPGTATILVTDNAVNLQYTLGTSATGGTGNGAAQSYSVTGTMASGQSGTCNTATCSNSGSTNRTHTLILTY